MQTQYRWVGKSYYRGTFNRRVIRDHRDQWLCVFHRTMHAPSSLMAKLWAIRDALSYAHMENDGSRFWVAVQDDGGGDMRIYGGFWAASWFRQQVSAVRSTAVEELWWQLTVVRSSVCFGGGRERASPFFGFGGC
ncbi:uncharacterized protein LOC131330777 [Rhododendron vialii]|uniref:uncharacterized protein LOC131330777 n=1 Tax=Rhododendron vialii TaxID=182163 RepID=UPI00265F0968|nr:uncharacterized protein LOC131330777 [Rhododendron vialii]